MKNLIIVSGHLGSTLSAAQTLCDMLGSADLYDTQKPCLISDFSEYDHFIFGTNVRMFRLNKRFRDVAKRLRKFYKDKQVYCYIMGADATRADRYENKAAKYLKNAVCVRYAGGWLDESNAGKFEKSIIVGAKESLSEEGKSFPEIRVEVLRKIADLILEEHYEAGETGGKNAR